MYYFHKNIVVHRFSPRRFYRQIQRQTNSQQSNQNFYIHGSEWITHRLDTQAQHMYTSMCHINGNNNSDDRSVYAESKVNKEKQRDQLLF